MCYKTTLASDTSIDFLIDFSIQSVRLHLAGLLIPCSLIWDAPIMRTTSAAAKPCQGDSSKFYLITGSIYTDQRGTVVLAMIGDIYKANAQGDTTKKTDNAQNHSVTGMSTNEVQLKNSFSSLGIITDDETDLELNNKGVDSVLNDSDSEEIKELILEGPNRNNTTITGASTPANTVSHD
ncbi:hypothetical protein Tco_1497346 [Tanacetum coccineum]